MNKRAFISVAAIITLSLAAIVAVIVVAQYGPGVSKTTDIFGTVKEGIGLEQAEIGFRAEPDEEFDLSQVEIYVSGQPGLIGYQIIPGDFFPTMDASLCKQSGTDELYRMTHSMVMAKMDMSGSNIDWFRYCVMGRDLKWDSPSYTNKGSETTYDSCGAEKYDPADKYGTPEYQYAITKISEGGDHIDWVRYMAIPNGYINYSDCFYYGKDEPTVEGYVVTYIREYKFDSDILDFDINCPDKKLTEKGLKACRLQRLGNYLYTGDALHYSMNFDLYDTKVQVFQGQIKEFEINEDIIEETRFTYWIEGDTYWCEKKSSSEDGIVNELGTIFEAEEGSFTCIKEGTEFIWKKEEVDTLRYSIVPANTFPTVLDDTCINFNARDRNTYLGKVMVGVDSHGTSVSHVTVCDLGRDIYLTGPIHHEDASKPPADTGWGGNDRINVLESKEENRPKEQWAMVRLDDHGTYIDDTDWAQLHNAYVDGGCRSSSEEITTNIEDYTLVKIHEYGDKKPVSGPYTDGKIKEEEICKIKRLGNYLEAEDGKLLYSMNYEPGHSLQYISQYLIEVYEINEGERGGIDHKIWTLVEYTCKVAEDIGLIEIDGQYYECKEIDGDIRFDVEVPSDEPWEIPSGSTCGGSTPVICSVLSDEVCEAVGCYIDCKAKSVYSGQQDFCDNWDGSYNNCVKALMKFDWDDTLYNVCEPGDCSGESKVCSEIPNEYCRMVGCTLST